MNIQAAGQPVRNVGYIGLGAIGLPMAERVLAAGFALHVWNRNSAKADTLIKRGAKLAASPADLAHRVEVLCLCVTDDRAVEEVVFGVRGIVSAGAGGLVVADNSTIHPATTRSIAARLASAGGGSWVDAPVSGGPAGARAGTLAVFAGGETGDVDRVRGVLMSFANRVTHMGGPGCGQATKACNQMLSFGTVAVLAEVLNLASRFGLDATRLPEALAGGLADSAVLRRYAPTMAAGEFTGSTLTALKDMEIALDLARETGSAIPMTGLLASFYRLLVSRGHTDDGVSGVMRLYADGPLPNPPRRTGAAPMAAQPESTVDWQRKTSG